MLLLPLPSFVTCQGSKTQWETLLKEKLVLTLLFSLSVPDRYYLLLIERVTMASILWRSINNSKILHFISNHCWMGPGITNQLQQLQHMGWYGVMYGQMGTYTRTIWWYQACARSKTVQKWLKTDDFFSLYMRLMRMSMRIYAHVHAHEKNIHMANTSGHGLKGICMYMLQLIWIIS